MRVNSPESGIAGRHIQWSSIGEAAQRTQRSAKWAKPNQQRPLNTSITTRPRMKLQFAGTGRGLPNAGSFHLMSVVAGKGALRGSEASTDRCLGEAIFIRFHDSV